MSYHLRHLLIFDAKPLKERPDEGILANRMPADGDSDRVAMFGFFDLADHFINGLPRPFLQVPAELVLEVAVGFFCRLVNKKRTVCEGRKHHVE